MSASRARVNLPRMIRHALLAIAATAALALSACGGDDEAASALDEAVGYLPDDAGFAFIAGAAIHPIVGEPRSALRLTPLPTRRPPRWAPVLPA